MIRLPSKHVGTRPAPARHYFWVLSSLSLALLSACGGTDSESPPPITEEPTFESIGQGASKTNNGLLSASASPATLKAAIQAGFRQDQDQDRVFEETDNSVAAPTASPAAPNSPNDDADNSSGDNFTQTNNQVAGVDEADTIKFNGEHFFISESDKIRVVTAGSAGDNQTQKLGYFHLLISYIPATEPNGQSPSPSPTPIPSVIDPGYSYTPITADLQLSDNHLAVLMENSGPSWIEPITATDTAVSAAAIAPSDYSPRYEFQVQGFTNVPQKLSQLEDDGDTEITPDWHYTIEGSLIDSRRIGDALYVVSRFTPQLLGYKPYTQSRDEQQQNEALINDLSLESVLPKVAYSGSDEITRLNTDGCYLQKDQTKVKTLTYVSKIDMATGELTSQCVGSYAEDIYVSQEQLFLFSSSHYFHFDFIALDNNFTPSTQVHGFALNDNLDYLGSGSVDGTPHCNPARYCMGSLNDGTFGIVTSQGDWDDPVHKLHVLEHQMTTQSENSAVHDWVTRSQLPNDAQPSAIGKPGERLYSVRFMQNRAYLVTFDRIDPLYVIDLNDTHQPNILGELEIPGYSDYLHPINNDLLIGIGKSAITGNSGTVWYQGVQVSLFDVSEPTSPKALTQLSLGKRGTDTAVSYSPKSFTGKVQGDDYVFALPVRLHNGAASGHFFRDPESQHYDFTHNGLHLFKIEDFLNSNTAKLEENSQHFTKIEACSNQGYYYSGTPPRSFFKADDVFYLCNGKLWLSPMDNAEVVQGDF